VAFAFLLTGTTKRNTLVEKAIIANFGGLADHHTHPVIDEETASDPGSGMDLNSRQPPAELRYESRHDRDACPIEPVSKTMQQDRVKSGITEEDFQGALRSRIFVENRLNLFPDGSEHDASLSLRPPWAVAESRCAYLDAHDFFHGATIADTMT
jgi:hypothetical protein